MSSSEVRDAVVQLVTFRLQDEIYGINVIFEAGLALGKYPERTILVQVGALKPFSDIAGRHFVRLRNSSKSRQELAQRLKLAGCEVNLSGTDWHDAGLFPEK